MRVLACLDERQPKRSLADDPNFLASLSELDRGLSDDNSEPAPAPARPMAPRLVPRNNPAPLIPPSARTPITVAAPPPPLAAPSAPTPSAVGLPEPPPWLPPSAFGAINAASAALSAAFESPAPAHASPASASPPPGDGLPRPLLEMFPPAASREATAPSLPLRETVPAPPPIAAVEPPRVAVKTRALPAAAPTPARATYETFYGLDEKPFGTTADLRFLYHSTAHDRALQELASSIAKRDAVALLTGEHGLGKTTVGRALIEQLDQRTLVSFVAEPPATAERLLSTMLVDFGVVSADDVAAGRLASASRVDLYAALRDFLGSLAVLQATALVVIDDADRLPAAVLREVQALVDLAATGKLLHVILIGEPSLVRQLKSSESRGIDDRIALRAELGVLEEDEIPGYVAHRLAVAGRGGRVGFSEVALRKIFSLSQGVPGAVNQICDRALTLGYQSSASAIDGDFVEEAAQQIGMLDADAGDSWRDRVLLAALMLTLTLAGAGIAGWVFREPLGRALAAWRG